MVECCTVGVVVNTVNEVGRRPEKMGTLKKLLPTAHGQATAGDGDVCMRFNRLEMLFPAS